MKMDKETYLNLLQEDINWLEQQEHSCEKDHILALLKMENKTLSLYNTPRDFTPFRKKVIINNEYYKLELFENNSAPCSYCHFLERPSLKCTFPDGNKKECEFKKGTKKGWNTFEYVKI